MTISGILDTETTGLRLPSISDLSKQPRIIELGFAVFEDGRLLEKENWLIHPGQEISAEITKITGITNQMLEGKPGFDAIRPSFELLVALCDVIYAHNAPFDVGMLEDEMKRCGKKLDWPEVVCTVQEYTHEFGKRMKLTDLYERKLGRPLAQTHRAIDDVMALSEVLLAEGLV